MSFLQANSSRRWPGITAVVLLLAISLACGGSGGATSAPTPAPAPTPGPSPAPAVAYHATAPAFCLHVAADSSCTDPAAQFASNIPTLNASTTISPLPPPGATVHYTWIADAVTGGPSNTTITTYDNVVQAMAPDITSLTVNSALSPPTPVWPVGSYHVTIELNGQMLTQGAFTITAS